MKKLFAYLTPATFLIFFSGCMLKTTALRRQDDAVFKTQLEYSRENQKIEDLYDTQFRVLQEQIVERDREIERLNRIIDDYKHNELHIYKNRLKGAAIDPDAGLSMDERAEKATKKTNVKFQDSINYDDIKTEPKDLPRWKYTPNSNTNTIPTVTGKK